MLKASGVFSICIAITYMIIALIHLSLPDIQKAGNSMSPEYLVSIAESPLLLVWQIRIFAVNAVLSIAVVFSLLQYIRSGQNGLSVWASALAVIGFAIIFYVSMLAQIEIPRIATSFVQSNETIKLAIIAQGLGFDDWMAFGLIGLWMIIVNYTGQKNRRLPLSLAIIGIISGFANFLIAFGTVARLVILITIAAILGGVLLGPVWYFWTGIIFLKESRKSFP